MKILNIILCMSVFGVVLTAQEKENYSGKIIDSETKQPIELVAVYTNSANTISNADGEYELKSERDVNVTFSHISYYAQTIHSQDLPDIIELKPKIFELSEIIIIPQEAIIKELKEVWNNYNKHLKGKKDKDFPKSTYYYRQLTFNNDTCVEYIESFFTAPASVRLNTLSLQEGRYARIKRDSIFWFKNYYNYSRLSPVSLKNAETKTINSLLCKDFEKYYNVSINKIISSDQSDEIRVYEFQPKGENMIKNSIFLSGLLYVRTEDQTIIQVELHTNSLGLTSSNVSIFNENHKIVISYRTASSAFPVVESVKVKSSIDAKINGQKYNMNIQSTLLSVEYAFNKKGNRLKYRDVLSHQVMTSEYNQEFWDQNPIVKRTKIEQQILNDFNREGYFGTMNLESH